MDRQSINYSDFVKARKSLLIAPAGFGKTHTIAKCLNFTSGRQLILTHTHAGIDSLKRKVQTLKIKSSSYQIETIAGYAQKYVRAFVKESLLPEQNDPTYYRILMEKAINLLSYQCVQKIISSTYAGLFVDEYQDCTIDQHKFILLLSNLLPTHIIGDPLQAIFNFKEPTIDLQGVENNNGFKSEGFTLEIPWRWKGRNEELAVCLKTLRETLLSKAVIDLRQFTAIELKIVANENDLYNPTTEYYKKLYRILGEKNVLIIHPQSVNSVVVRKNIVSKFNIPISLVEAIDDKDFYRLADICDSINSTNLALKLYQLCEALFPVTALKIWVTSSGIVKKKASSSEENKKLSSNLSEIYNAFKIELNFSHLVKLLKFLRKEMKLKIYRKELFNSICASLETGSIQNLSVRKSMEERRNVIRRMGRRIENKAIGTTLLTKGLEFETVVILNANKFNTPQDLYVALTRASKRLIVFTTNAQLNPY